MVLSVIKSTNLDLEGHLNRYIGSKVTAILVNGGILRVRPAACAADLFLNSHYFTRNCLNCTSGKESVLNIRAVQYI